MTVLILLRKIMKMMENKEWYSVGAAAKMLGVSTQLIYYRIKDGQYETMEYKRGSKRSKGILIKLDNNGI